MVGSPQYTVYKCLAPETMRNSAKSDAQGGVEFGVHGRKVKAVRKLSYIGFELIRFENLHRLSMPLIRLTHLLIFCLLTSWMFAQTDGNPQHRIKNPTLPSMVRGGGVAIPYPILYVHGLVGSDATWHRDVGMA